MREGSKSKRDEMAMIRTDGGSASKDAIPSTVRYVPAKGEERQVALCALRVREAAKPKSDAVIIKPAGVELIVRRKESCGLTSSSQECSTPVKVFAKQTPPWQ